MGTSQITVHDALTNETTVREMTDEEIAQLPTPEVPAPVEEAQTSTDAG